MSDVVICLFAAAGYDRAAQGLTGAGRRLADALGVRLRAITVGAHSELNLRIAAAADTVISADQSELIEYQPELCLHALTQLTRDYVPRAVLLSNDTYSQELAPRLAHRLGGSSAGDAVELSAQDGAIRLKRSVYGGKAVATIDIKRSPAVIWLRARAFEPVAAGSYSLATVRQMTLSLPAVPPTLIIERKSEITGETKLEDARIIVSGGRGLGGPKPFEDLREIADLIGAQLAASRAPCDAGWCSHSLQVGQSGKKVAPDLYLAVAIHGASQHLVGISDSKVIAAINIDPAAPIFKHSQFGIVEDYRKVIPLLKEKLAALQA
ncbi:MAG: electron transfer flavoprotein subunit alpha/FixB family protein [Acidobacteria bacterium]|nr:electron transfer flavoprotein subunit alpha/FixB family protein [Acidobacteriota bacterium]